MKGELLGALCFMGLSIPVLLIGLLLLLRSIRLSLHGVRVNGLVVGSYTGNESEKYPIVEFTDLLGVLRRKNLGMSGHGITTVGQPLALIYDPENPTVVSPVAALWLWPGISCLLGGIAFLAGLGILTGTLPTK
jgi:hypothetical protein